jgi:isoquinoline 1-oxidoreductase beta subunit
MSEQLTRRGFLVALGATGAGLSLGIRPAHGAASDAAGPDGSFAPNAFIRLDTDGTATIQCHWAEMGQGVRATVPWIIAAEMGCDFDRVVVEQAVGDKRYGNQNTDGSTSIRGAWPLLREIGAVGRAMLVAAAAEQWGVPAGRLVAEDHVVTDPETGETLAFGALATAAAQRDVPKDAPLKPSLEHLAKKMPFRDATDIATGTAVFGADVELEGLRIAVVARPPDVGGRVESFDATDALAVPGVEHVLEMPKWQSPAFFQPLGGVAVVATNTWAAMEGRRKLKITWKPGKHAGTSTEADYAEMRDAVDAKGRRKRTVGKADRALEEAARTHTAVYRVPHLAHAPMEPLVATAWVHDNRCEVWAPVQAPQRTRGRVAPLARVPKRNTTVNVTLLGGGFGRKGKPDFVLEAVYLSRELGIPIRVQWDRTDDVKHSYYHALAIQRLDAGFAGDGSLVAWRHRVAEPTIFSTFLPIFHRAQGLELGQGLMDLALDVPNIAFETHPAPNRVRIGWFRSVYNINHALATQCFVDELAEQAGVSTPVMLKRVLGRPRILTEREAGANIWNYGSSHDEHPPDVGRWHGVIDAVVRESGYEQGAGEGRAFGFAAHSSFNSYTACVVAMTKTDRGEPKLDEAWIAVDAGTILNPDRVRSQMEGAVIFGASLALKSNITLTDGVVDQSNFHDYQVLRMNEAPRAIHVILANNGHSPGGVGEPGVPPVAPAILNGWYALTGERVRTLPMIGRT